MTKEKQEPRRLKTFIRLARYIGRYKVTAAGWLATFAAALSWIMVSNVTVPVLHMACALTGLIVATFFTAILIRPRLDVTGEMPKKTAALQTVDGNFVLANRSRISAFDISLGFFYLPESLRQDLTDNETVSLAPGKSATVAARVRPAKRGLYALPAVSPFSTFPFHLFRTKAKTPVRHTHPFLVLPAFHRLTEIDVPLGRRYQPGGVTLTSNIGESAEYIGNREYHAGDPTRRIDFRSWGRLFFIKSADCACRSRFSPRRAYRSIRLRVCIGPIFSRAPGRANVSQDSRRTPPSFHPAFGMPGHGARTSSISRTRRRRRGTFAGAMAILIICWRRRNTSAATLPTCRSRAVSNARDSLVP